MWKLQKNWFGKYRIQADFGQHPPRANRLVLAKGSWLSIRPISDQVEFVLTKYTLSEKSHTLVASIIEPHSLSIDRRIRPIVEECNQEIHIIFQPSVCEKPKPSSRS